MNVAVIFVIDMLIKRETNLFDKMNKKTKLNFFSCNKSKFDQESRN